ncbi:hypothetical protein J5N97_011378 [Dioscorea zingiberensis]|uniref:TRM5/TYW2-like methyltransferase domain-containing protein n=1 Tax=Dioscorea zingiberensis TaxID=325984 RepID=A0A9D5D2X7_9LILI|nr:hypothetical protein J5N97_011378 [Dioscorea zingiberensis]
MGLRPSLIGKDNEDLVSSLLKREGACCHPSYCVAIAHQAKLVYACEWNPHAINALQRNVHENSVADHCVILEGDNRVTAPTFVCPSVNDPGLSGHSDDVYEIYHMNSNHNMYPFQAATLDGINMEKNFSVADSNTENALEASCSVNECVTLQALHDNVDQGGMDINGNWNQEACLPSGTDNKNISASLSNHTGESSAVDYQDCGVSPILINNESPLWDSNLDANYPQARNEAKMRYK